jgi:hypothetical protein
MKKCWLVVIAALIVMFLIFLIIVPRAGSLTVHNIKTCTDISTVISKTFTDTQRGKEIISLKLKIKGEGMMMRKINSEFIDALRQDGWQFVRFEVIENLSDGTKLKDFKKESVCTDVVDEIDKLPVDIQMEISDDIAGIDITFRNMIFDKDPKSLFNKKVCRRCLPPYGQENEKMKGDRIDFYKAVLKIVNESILEN